MTRWIFLLFAIVGALGESFSQGNGVYFHHLTLEDGLTDGTNYFVSKDSRGFVWLSSTSGLNRYDGKQVKEYLPDTGGDSTALFGENIQSKMFEVENGDLWFTTYEGVNLYRRKTDDFWHTRMVDGNGEMIKGYHAFHFDPKGFLWMIIDNQEVQVFDTNTKTFQFKFSLPRITQRISPLLADDGSIRQFLSRSNLAELTKTTYNQDDTFTQNSRRLIYHGDSLDIVQVLPISDTLSWLATVSGFFSYNWEKDELHRYAMYDDKELKACKTVIHYRDNNLLLSFENEGIFVFDQGKRRFIEQFVPDLRNPNTLSTNNIPVINALDDGSFWLSAEPNGIEYFYPGEKKFNVISLPLDYGEQFSPFDVTSLMEDSYGNIWCGTSYQGLLVFDANGKILTQFQQDSPYAQTAPNKIIYDIFEDGEGRIWIMGESGTMVWLPDEKSFIQVSDLFTLYGLQLSDGRIVLSLLSPGGLVQVVESTAGEFQFRQITSVDTSGAFLSLWQDTEGRLFGCKDLISISVFDPGNDFKLIKELPYSDYSSFFQAAPDSALWISNSYGLLKLNITLDEKSAVRFTAKDGLPSSHILGLLPDDNGYFWIGTFKGLSRFNISKKVFQNFNLSDGLPSLIFSKLARLKRKNGEFWFGTTNGIVTFYPGQIELQKNKTTPAITSILVNDVELPGITCSITGATNINEIQRIELPFEQNTLSFTFAALDYSDPGNILYTFQMEGLDADWLTPSPHDFTRYAKIPFGAYVFKLKATNSDGQWGTVRRLEVYIGRPWYRTWGFYLTIGALMLAGISFIMWLRQQRRNRIARGEEEKREALEQERQRIARDMHDDLGSSLSALSLTTEIARHKKTSELRAEIERINTSAREISGKIREVIWTVSSRNDSLENLISYLNNYAHDLFESSSQDINLSLPESIPSVFINGEYRRNIFLAFKEALNNLMKYAEATKVSIDIETTGEQFSIRIMDNGKGFDPSLLQNSPGNGLRNMQSRMSHIGGTCKITTGQNGTTVEFGLGLER